MFCEKCGKENNNQDKYCWNCGELLKKGYPGERPTQSSSNQVQSEQPKVVSYSGELSSDKQHKGRDCRILVGVSIILVLTLWILIYNVGTSIVGTWYSEELDDTWTFYKNGTLEDGYGYTTEYRTSGKRLYIEDEDDDVIYFKIHGDTLILYSDDWDEEHRFKRE